MQIIHYKICGFYVIKVEKSKAARAFNALMKNGICAVTAGDDGFCIHPTDKRKIEAALVGIPYTVSALRGLPSIVRPALSHAGAFLAVLLCAVLFFALRLRVFDIRAEEDSEVPLSVIERELSNVGFSAGTKWKESDLSVIENAVLSASDEIGWIGIHRRGAVAYVGARKKTEKESEPVPVGYANVVAAFDGVVEEITVKKGTAVVAVGDTVKKGDLLISGIQNVGSATVFTEAAGEVGIRTTESMEISVLFESEKPVLEKRGIASFGIVIFGKEINIFKNSRKYTPECVIINKNTRAVVLGKYRLPIAVSVCYAFATESEKKVLSEADAENTAKSRFETALRLRLSDADLLNLRYDSVFSEDGCSVVGEYTAIRQGGKTVEIAIER